MSIWPLVLRLLGNIKYSLGFEQELLETLRLLALSDFMCAAVFLSKFEVIVKSINILCQFYW
jgi:hypothetical protein